MRIVLTGGIATGKSTVARVLRREGVPIVDADALARDAVAPGSVGLAAVAQRFGQEVLASDGSLQRAALGRIVFSDADARRALERIVHPFVRAGIGDFFTSLPPDGVPGVAEIPLAYETGWAATFDHVIVVACRPGTQLSRLIARDGVTEEEARARLSAQWPIEDKVRLADSVLSTDGDEASTAARARRLAAWIRSRRRPS